MSNYLLNPGSKEAQKVGCTCPVLDNEYGKGYLGDGKKFGWVMNCNCPIHGHNINKEKYND